MELHQLELIHLQVQLVDSEVFRADGSYDMFQRDRDPEIRADFVGFQKRFAAGQTASRGVGAIVTVA
jgi:hypothetical protein